MAGREPKMQPDMSPTVIGPPGDTGGTPFMQKKILGLPAPIVLVGAAVVLFLVYRHYKSNAISSTSGTSGATNPPDPNAIDPNTGLTYGAEETAGLNAMNPVGVNGTGMQGTAGSNGFSVGDLESLLQTMAQLNQQQTPAAAAPTPTLDQAGNGANPSPQIIVISPTAAQSAPPPATSSPAGPAPAVVNPEPDVAPVGGLDLLGTNQYGGTLPPVAAGTTIPKTSTTPYAVSSPANKSGLSATPKQGVISVH